MAKHLVHTYGSCAFAVCEMSKPTGKRWPRFGKRLVDGYPFIEAEVEYAAKHEYAVSVKDMISLRMRLCYLNSTAAKEAIPRVTELMAAQLGWSKAEKAKQMEEAMNHVKEFAGPLKDTANAKLRAATYTDITDAFNQFDADGNGYIDAKELETAAITLGFPFRSVAERDRAFKEIDKDGSGRIAQDAFVEWWNNKDDVSKKLHRQLSLTATAEVALDKMFDEDKKAKGKKA